jgi:N-acetyltransferase
MSVESPPTGLVSECDNTAHYVVKSGGTQFGTPTSFDNEAEFGTPPTHDKDSIDKGNGAAVDRATNSNLTLQSAAFGTTNNRQTNKSDKPRKKSQMYLDLGQKSFASHKICPICSSLIVHGTVEDQQNHIQICKSYKEGVTCLGFKKERCVGRFGEERILEVRENDSVGKNKAEEVKRIVDGELGFAISSKSKLDKQNDLLQGMTSYLYIAKKRIVGLLLVKRINKAYELLHEKADGRTSSISRDTKPHPVIMGVHQIWVHNLHRHKGIATKLLECARGSFTFGMVIPIEKVAFSSPTEDGVGLAKRFVGDGEKVLVYDVC